jgi:hypothetical protein
MSSRSLSSWIPPTSREPSATTPHRSGKPSSVPYGGTVRSAQPEREVELSARCSRRRVAQAQGRKSLGVPPGGPSLNTFTVHGGHRLQALRLQGGEPTGGGAISPELRVDEAARQRPEIKRYLGALPFRMDPRPTGGHKSRPQLILVHGTPTLNTLYWTEDRPDSFCAKMAKAAGARETWSPSAIPASPGTARSGAYTSSTPDRCRPKTGTSNAPSVDLAGTRSTRSNRLFSTACSASCRPL